MINSVGQDLGGVSVTPIGVNIFGSTFSMNGQNGISATFSSAGGQVLTITNGIITGIA